ncbi:hypothetical protein ACIRYZ_27600 [Kitasatospora sp. NPDC101155]|uniref:hypothetical protein n=1 Tax=Kitasatospora sp. NPDC101155 TaxID=3364097 RepID=UPI00382EA123
MTVVVGAALVALLVLTLAGCGCVVWAERGGPRWVRAVAAVTLGAGEVLRRLERSQRRRRRSVSGGDGGAGD